MAASAPLRIVVTNPFVNPRAIELLKASGGDVVELLDTLSEDEVERAIIDHDPHGILSRTFRISARAIEGSPSLKVISKHGSGVDNIDLDAARRRGVMITNCAGVNAAAVAEHALSLILAIAKNLSFHDHELRGGSWSRFKRPAVLLKGRRLGLVGFGHIARRLAILAKALEMPVIAWGPRLQASAVPEGVILATSLHALLEEAETVSLHCPASAETRHMIGARELALMGSDAWLINTARGSVVDEAALIAALQTGTIAAAGLDTYEREPIQPDNPLLGMPNVVLTPHCAGATRESTGLVGLKAAENLIAVLEGREIDKGLIVLGNADR